MKERWKPMEIDLMLVGTRQNVDLLKPSLMWVSKEQPQDPEYSVPSKVLATAEFTSPITPDDSQVPPNPIKEKQ
jgi:hypothetical protein